MGSGEWVREAVGRERGRRGGVRQGGKGEDKARAVELGQVAGVRRRNDGGVEQREVWWVA